MTKINKYFQGIESHIVNTVIGVAITGTGFGAIMFVTFYFSTNNALAQTAKTLDAVVKKVDIIEKDPTKTIVLELQRELVNLKELQKENRLQDRKDHNEVMKLLIQLNRK